MKRKTYLITVIRTNSLMGEVLVSTMLFFIAAGVLFALINRVLRSVVPRGVLTVWKLRGELALIVVPSRYLTHQISHGVVPCFTWSD